MRLRARLANWLLRDVDIDVAVRFRAAAFGRNSISLSPSGVGDVIRWSSSQAPVAAGDLGMDPTTGRPQARIGGSTRDLVHRDEVGALLAWGSGDVGTLADTRYLAPWIDGLLAVLSPVRFRAPRAGTVKNLRVDHGTVGTGTGTATYTLRVNGAGSVLKTSAVAVTAAGGTDLVNTVTIAAGDLLDLEVVKAGVVTTAPLSVVATVEFAP